MATYFITPAWLTSHGIFNKNVDELLYTSYVEGVAKAYLKSELGTHFFTDLYNKYNAQTLSTDEQVVVTKMQWAIAFRLKAEVTIEASYQLTNKGLVKQSDDNAEPVELKEFQMRYDSLISRAIQYELDLKKWLKDNSNLYPEFLISTNNDSKWKVECCTGHGQDYADGQGTYIL